MNKSGYRILRVAGMIVGGLLVGAAPVPAQWITYDATTQNYTNTANWAGGVIDNVFNSSSTAWAQTINFTADLTLSNGLTITRNPATAAAGNVVFQGSGGNRILTLGGNVTVTGSGNGNSKLVILGSNTAGQQLTLNLGDTTRTFNITNFPDDDAGRAYGFVVEGPVTGSGGLTKVGNGVLEFWGTNTQTFTGPLTINQGEVLLTDKVTLTTTNIFIQNTLNSLTSVPTAAYASQLQSSSRNIPVGAVNNRINPNTTLTMDGGRFTMFQNSSNPLGTQEEFKQVILENGLALFDSYSRTFAGGVPVKVTIDTLSRPNNAPMAFAVETNNFAYGTGGFGIGAGLTQYSIGNYNASWEIGGILPFAVIGNVNTAYGVPDTIYAPAAYDTSGGGFVKAATVTTHTQLSAALAGENVVISPGVNDDSVTTGMTKDMNALIIAPTANQLNISESGNAGTIRLASGQLVYSPTSGYTTHTFVTFDMSGQHAYVFATLNGNLEIQGAITNATGATFAGYSGGGNIVLDGPNYWSGATTIASGVVYGNNLNAIPSNSAVNIASGALLKNNYGGSTIGSLAGSGALQINHAGVTIGADNTSTEFSGQIYGDPAFASYLTKIGTGTQILSGESFYTGLTTVSNGTLIVNGTHTGAGAYTVVNGATLGGSGIISGSAMVSIHNGGTVSPGLDSGTLTLTVPNLTLATGATYQYEPGDLLAVTGQLTLSNNWVLALSQQGSGLGNGGSLTLFTFATTNAAANAFDLTPLLVGTNFANLGFTPGAIGLEVQGNKLILTGLYVVPEPTELLLMCMGGCLVVWWRRRQS